MIAATFCCASFSLGAPVTCDALRGPFALTSKHSSASHAQLASRLAPGLARSDISAGRICEHLTRFSIRLRSKKLDEIVEYANRFHHDTNPAWETEAINDAELRGFVERTLRFCRR